MKTAIILVLILLIAVQCEQPYHKVIHQTDPEAKCLDGSPAGLFLHQGTQKNKFLIYFVGGGLCSGQTLDETLEDCLKRSKTQLGSSTLWPSQINAESLGYLSTNPLRNHFAEWIKLIFIYCDGSLHQGYRQSPLEYKGTSLYFRGNLITKSHFKWLLAEHNFENAEQVLVTGLSAGGIATFLWTNYVTSLVKNPQVVKSAPDSGIFLRYQAYKTEENILQNMVVNMFKLADLQQKTPLQECNSDYKGEEWKCLFFENAHLYQRFPTLVINSEYDSFQIGVSMGIDCLTPGSSGATLAKCDKDQLSYIEGHRSKFAIVLTDFLSRSNNSAWTISCSNHGYASSNHFFDRNEEKVPAKTGKTVKQALEEFINGKRVMSVDVVPWPMNTGCAY